MGPYKYMGQSNDSLIPEWTAKDLARTMEIKRSREMKKESDKSIEKLITQIVQATKHLNSRQTEMIALRIYTKIIKG